MRLALVTTLLLPLALAPSHAGGVGPPAPGLWLEMHSWRLAGFGTGTLPIPKFRAFKGTFRGASIRIEHDVSLTYEFSNGTPMPRMFQARVLPSTNLMTQVGTICGSTTGITGDTSQMVMLMPFESKLVTIRSKSVATFDKNASFCGLVGSGPLGTYDASTGLLFGVPNHVDSALIGASGYHATRVLYRYGP